MALKLQNEVNKGVIGQKRLKVSVHTRGGVLEDVLGLEDVLEDTF